MVCEKLRAESGSYSLLKASLILCSQLLIWWLPADFVISSAPSSQPCLHFSFFGLCSVPSAKHKQILTSSVTMYSAVASFRCPDTVAAFSDLKFYHIFHAHKYPCSSQTSSRPVAIVWHLRIKKNPSEYHKQQSVRILKYKSMRSGKVIYHQNGSWLLAFICFILLWSLFILKRLSAKQRLSSQDLKFALKITYWLTSGITFTLHNVRCDRRS